MLSLTSSGLVFVLMGKQAQELESLIGQQHFVFKTYHPAYATRTGTDWDCDDVFNKVNEILLQNNGEDLQIKW
jgi:uracil DNA glycosylase